MHGDKGISYIEMLAVTMSLFPISPACPDVCGWRLEPQTHVDKMVSDLGLLAMTKALFVKFLSLYVIRGTPVQCGEK